MAAKKPTISISITIPSSTAALLEKHCTILGVSHSTYLCGMIEDRERRHQRLMQESADAEVARMKRILSNA